MTDFAKRRMTMVDTQVRPNDVTKFPIIEAMLSVPREEFVPEALRESAYVGENVDLGGGRVMLEPRTLAKMLDAVDVQPGERVLDVGAGFGYSSALLARMGAQVVALDDDAERARKTETALAGAAKVVVGPLSAGSKAEGPFDVITIQGGVEDVPAALLDQLAEGGRIGCVFVNRALGECRVGLKSGGAVSWRFAFNAVAPVLEDFRAKKAFVL